MVIIKDLLHGQLIDFELDCPIIQHSSSIFQFDEIVAPSFTKYLISNYKTTLDFCSFKLRLHPQFL